MIQVIVSISGEFWGVLCEMAPYLLFGFLAAGTLSVAISPSTVERHLGSGGIWPVIKATVFGIPLPLCSCGVIPVAASLRRHRASRGATAAFLLSTPQTGVDSIFVTLSLLGPVFAVFRPLAAFVSGIIGGSLITLLDSDDEPQPETVSPSQDDCSNPALESRGLVYRVFHYGFVTLPSDIGRPMMIGLVLAGIISWIIPDDFFAEILGTGIAAKLVMMVAGIPLYVCATASVPIVAAFIAKGMSPGAALVFLMTGPATNAAAITIIWKLLGKRTTIIYLGTVAVLSITFGVLLDGIFAMKGVSAEPGMSWMLPDSVKTAAGVVLLGIFAAALRPRFTEKDTTVAKKKGDKEMDKVTLQITGMTCTHCADTIKRSLTELAGIDSVEIDLADGKGIVSGRDLDVDSLCRVISELGYDSALLEEGG